MAQPKVSVIIPTLHRPDLLKGAIRTVINQSYNNIEIVIVNDDAQDERTRDVINKYDKNLELITVHNDKPKGLSASRNQAADLATGKYLCILDDDDRWDVKKVERQVKIFEEGPDELGVVYTGGDAIDKRGNQVSIHHVSDDRQGDIWPDILSDWGLDPHSGHMIRREAFESVNGFDESLKHGEDWDLSIRISKNYQFFGIEDLLTHKLNHSDNISNSRAHANQRQQILLKYGNEIFSREDIQNEFFALWHRRLGRHEMRNGNRIKAIKQQITSFGHQPKMSIILDIIVSIGGKSIYEVVSKINKKMIVLRRHDII